MRIGDVKPTQGKKYLISPDPFYGRCYISILKGKAMDIEEIQSKKIHESYADTERNGQKLLSDFADIANDLISMSNGVNVSKISHSAEYIHIIDSVKRDIFEYINRNKETRTKTKHHKEMWRRWVVRKNEFTAWTPQIYENKNDFGVVVVYLAWKLSNDRVVIFSCHVPKNTNPEDIDSVAIYSSRRGIRTKVYTRKRK